MAINFNLWFSPGGLLADTKAIRVSEQGRGLGLPSPQPGAVAAEVQARVTAFSGRPGTARADSVLRRIRRWPSAITDGLARDA